MLNLFYGILIYILNQLIYMKLMQSVFLCTFLFFRIHLTTLELHLFEVLPDAKVINENICEKSDKERKATKKFDFKYLTVIFLNNYIK